MMWFVRIVSYKGYCHVSVFPWRIITGSGSDDWIYWQFYYNHNPLYQPTINDYLRLAPFLTGRVFSTVTNDEWRITSDWNLLHWTNFQAKSSSLILCYIRCYETCMANRWLAMDYSDFSLSRERVLQNRCLAMVCLKIRLWTLLSI
jgi:hypothetical protein